MTAALALCHVEVSFDGRFAIEDATVEFEAGVTYAVVGRSGAGKSVLMKAAAGLLHHAGEVRVHGAPLVYVHQDPALLDDLGVEENVAFAVSRVRLARADVSRRVEQALLMLDLCAVRDERPARLPLAVQKRVALARALALEPAILIVDEPTTGLDPIAAHTVDSALVALTRAHATRTLIVVTHSPRTIQALDPRLVVITNGRVEARA